MMKNRRILLSGARVCLLALLLVPATGCPRKKVIFHLSPDNMLFSAPQDGPAPGDQVLTMTGIDDIPPNGAPWSLSVDQPWLSVQPTSGTLHANEPIVLTVSADQSFLLEGLYSGQISIIARYGRHYYPQTYEVTLNVSAGQSPPPIVTEPESELEVVVEIPAESD